MKNFKKGFTLIELLVVVAIIGILASVVLASLNTARSKGSDAATKANLDDMRAQAAIDYDTWGNNYYASGGSANAAIQTVTSATTCPQANTLGLTFDTTFCNGVVAAASSSSASVLLNSLGQTWVAGAALKNNNAAGHAQWWCVDSTGNSKAEDATVTTLAAGVVLAATNCP
jgi:prepilin-type N-terminal cleavage/methylation domain-containing protein